MSDLDDLYRETILDHTKRPRNFGKPEGATHTAQGYNPLCGDRVTIYLTVDGDTVREIAFDGSGCAISTASASMMTEALRGKTGEEIEALFHSFHGLVTGDPAADDLRPGLGKLLVFSGVGEYPTRVKCATLAWHTLRAALEKQTATVTTE